MDTNFIKNIIRIGRVSSIDVNTNTARVAFSDKDDLVSGNLMIVNRGSMVVLCLMLPNKSGQGLNEGFIIGSFFSKEDEPQERSADVRAIKFGDGTVIKHDRKSGSLTVNAIGDISIIAAGTLTIRGAAVNIN